MLILILSLSLIISPNPLRTDIHTPVKITVSTDNGEDVGGVNFLVKPASLGKVENGVFTPEKAGRGIILCSARVDGVMLRKAVLLVVEEDISPVIQPSFARLDVGERIKFNVKGGRVKRWGIFPKRIGKIENGLFTAEEPGKGRVVAILETGEVLSGIVIVGRGTLKIKLSPSFVQIDVGGSVDFVPDEMPKNPVWMVIPEGVGRVDGSGHFVGLKPGRAIVFLKGDKNGNTAIGRAVVIVKGGGVRIVPGRAVLKRGESVVFKVVDETGKIVQNVKWKAIPARIGRVSPNGMFTPTVQAGKGKIVGILPRGYSRRVVSAPVLVVPGRRISLRITPNFVKLKRAGEQVVFYTEIYGTKINEQVDYSVYPEDLGTITKEGLFTAKRTGTGIVIARLKGNIPIRPARAVIIVGDVGIPLQVSPRDPILKPGDRIRFKITSSKPIPEGVKFVWRVKPLYLGKIGSDGTFKAGMIPNGSSYMLGKVVVVGVKDGSICCYGWTAVTVKR